MHPAEAADESLHVPADRRLWNESYYFHFDGERFVGHTRIGLQPYENRANVWVYVHDAEAGRTYWIRDENLGPDDGHGLAVATDGCSVSYRPIEPLVGWALEASGRFHTASAIRDVFEGGAGGAADEGTSVDLDLSFVARDHDAYQEERGYDAHSEDKEHYSQPGRIEGSIRIDGTEHGVDAPAFRDHSWGGLRNWTPVAGGYYWFGLQCGADAFKIAAGLQPDGTVVDEVHGYHADGDRVRVAEGVAVEYDDGLTPDERLEAWIDGELPEAIAVEFHLEDGTESLELRPRWNTPLGYEDRNWAATSLASPWLTAVINRLPVEVQWDGRRGTGWFETMHPRTR